MFSKSLSYPLIPFRDIGCQQNVAVQQMAVQNFGDVTMEEWTAVCRHVKAVEEEYMGREHEMDSVMERIIINTGDDDDVRICSCDNIQGNGPIVSDSE